MNLYFWILRLAALFGHRKAKQLVAGQAQAITELREWRATTCGMPVLWIHVASVGEFEQVRPIIERLHRELPFRKVLLTFFSPSGYELRKNYQLVDKVLYLPFATHRNAKKWLEVLAPEMAVFVKYEFWPAYLNALKKNDIPTYLISAIFRPKQLFFKPWGKAYLKLLYTFKHIFVQDSASADLLQQHGIADVTVAGDTRFDRVVEVRKMAKDLPIVDGFVADAERVIVAGSTWPEEEQMFARYVAEHEDVKLVLVPHEIHSDHLHQIFQYFEGRYVRYTEATAASVDKCRVLLVDTIGLLSSIYRYGHVAYIGGGFGAGIHNTLEAAVYGMPVVFGPKWQKFREARGLLNAGAAKSVKNYREFAAALDKAFEQQAAMGQAAADYVNSELGATEKIYQEIF
ncbi:MAG: 3-deoxy-D-manno-octulosonic acid transferase [Paludibacteraceae bacterium]|nr:3-deoxy-D-manno-octulosonic acid transferase [Paludibacteraceae bacterium]